MTGWLLSAEVENFFFEQQISVNFSSGMSNKSMLTFTRTLPQMGSGQHEGIVKLCCLFSNIRKGRLHYIHPVVITGWLMSPIFFPSPNISSLSFSSSPPTKYVFFEYFPPSSFLFFRQHINIKDLNIIKSFALLRDGFTKNSCFSSGFCPNFLSPFHKCIFGQ